MSLECTDNYCEMYEAPTSQLHRALRQGGRNHLSRLGYRLLLLALVSIVFCLFRHVLATPGNPIGHLFKSPKSYAKEHPLQATAACLALYGAVATYFLCRSRRRLSSLSKDYSAERYRSLVESSPNWISLVDARGKIMTVNQSVLTQMGWKKSLVIGRDYCAIWSDASRPNVRTAIRDALKGKSVTFSAECTEGETHTIWSVVVNPIRDKDGRIRSLVCIGSDHTQVWHTKNALKKSEACYGLLSEYTNDVIWTMDRGYKYTYISPSVERLAGYSADEIIGKPMTDFIAPGSLDTFIGAMEEMVVAIQERGAANPVCTKEIEITKKDGKTLWVEAKATPLYDANRKVTGLVGISRDITESKLVEKSLRTEGERLLSIFESINHYIYVADPATHEVLYANKFLRDAIGYDLVGKTCYEVLQGKKTPCQFCTSEALLSRKSVEWEHYNKALGKHFMISDRMLKWPDGRDVRFEFAVDITGHRDLEDKLETRLAYENMLSDISFSAVTIDDESIFLENCMKTMGEVLGVSRVYIFQHKPETNTTDNTYEWVGKGIEAMRAILQDIPAEELRWWVDILRENETICYSDIEEIPDDTTRSTLARQNIKSILVVPLFVGKSYYGFLGFDECASNREWPLEDVYLLRTVAQIICGVIERKQTEHSLKIQTSAMNAASDQIVITNSDGCIEFVNPVFERETGYALREVAGKKASILKSGKHSEKFYAAMWNTILAGKTWRGEITNRRKDGELYTEDVTITPVKDPDGQIHHFIAIKRNITEKKIYEERLNRLAHHDALTGLPNRLLFSHTLTRVLSLPRRPGRLVAVMFLDLNRFKQINDTLGHNAGDFLLRSVSDRLTGVLPEADTIARMGGDEFTIILADMENQNDVILAAEKVLDVFTEPFELFGQEIYVSTSIGISLYPTDGMDVETLVRNADVAMYRAKEGGQNSYSFYTPSLNDAAFARMSLEGSLRRAIEREELTLFYQPQVDLKTGALIGAEALVRWMHPEHGLISPAQFIPLSEETGLIVPISEWVLKTACSQIKAWQDAGLPAVQVGVNISALHFQQGDLIGAVESALHLSGIDTRYLALELTESSVMTDPSLAVEILNKLQEMGVSISIDDFGTGYSSLSYLKGFPIDVVKIDRSFVKDITTNMDDEAIARAIIAMAHTLKLKVIAEGVETLEQLEFMRSLNCDEIQGYFISRPVPAQEFEAQLRELLQERENGSKAA